MQANASGLSPIVVLLEGQPKLVCLSAQSLLCVAMDVSKTFQSLGVVGHTVTPIAQGDLGMRYW